MKILNGWHKIEGYNVFTEGGMITRGTLGSGSSYRSAWPYRFDVRDMCWHKCSPISVSAFRAGVKRGTIELK